jgi:MFS family permease
VFACVLIVAGGIQDKYGPRITALIGGLMIGTGFVWMSQTSAYLSWVLAFGVLVGSGIAFAYSATTPAALKWFHQSKSGMISGIVVAGFGLAPVYIAPLAQYLLNAHGIRNSMMIFGFSFFIVISLLALFLKNPPAGFSPPGSFAEKRSPDRQGVRTKFQSTHAGPTEIIRQPFFWLLWVLFFIGAGAGLMVIGSVAGMAKASMGQNAFIAVAIMAIGNAGGRIAAGMLSDKIGRKLTLLAIIGFQALLMFAAIPLTSSTFSSPAIIVILAALMGFNYGANLALFPSYAKDLWGYEKFRHELRHPLHRLGFRWTGNEPLLRVTGSEERFLSGVIHCSGNPAFSGYRNHPLHAGQKRRNATGTAPPASSTGDQLIITFLLRPDYDIQGNCMAYC